MPDVMASFENPNGLVALFLVTLVIFGMVFGEVTFGPLSDAFGRKPAILSGLAIFMIGTLFVLFAPSLEFLMLGRVLQGIGVSGPKIGTRAIIRDQYKGPDMARVMSIIFGILIFVPMIAPLIGKLLGDSFGWRGVFWFLMALAVTVSSWLALGQGETLPPSARQSISIKIMAANIGLIVNHRRVLCYTLIAGLIFSIQLFFLSVAVSIFDDAYNRTESFVYWFALLAGAMACGSLSNSRALRTFSMDALVTSAALVITLAGSVMLFLPLVADKAVNFSLFIGAMMLVFFCIGIVFGNINAMAMVYLGRVAGLGASMIASLSSLVAFSVASILAFCTMAVQPSWPSWCF